jgi:tetratricopeptide (TPR) repeat protein/Zn-dependent membrane protease YugP
MLDFNYLPLAHEGIGQLFMVLGVVAALYILKWANERHARICRAHGTVLASCGLTGQLMAQRLLALCGLGNVPVLRSTQLNYYQPWRRQIRLNRTTFDSPTLLAVTIAAHEVGHAQQFAAKTLPSRIRNIVWPLCYVFIALMVLMPILLMADVIDWPGEHFADWMLGIGFFIVLIQVPIHLPLESDASRRARKLVRDAKLLGPGEEQSFDAMLQSAWVTHAARQAQGWVCLGTVAMVLCVFPSFLSLPDDPEQADQRNVMAANQPPPRVVAPPVVAPPQGQPDLVAQQPFADFDDPLMPLNAFSLLFSLAIGIVPLLVVSFLTAKLRGGGRQSRSAAEDAILRNNAALTLHDKGAFAAAKAACDEALRLDPTLAAAYFNRGQVHLQMGSLDQALTDFETHLRLVSGNSFAIAARGEVHLRRGHLDLAVADYESAVRLAPENTFFLVRRGQIQLAKNNFDQAIADLSAAIERDPRQPDAWRDRGLARYWKNDFEHAIADLDEAIRLAPLDAVAFNNRGAAHLKAGQFTQARADLQESLRLAPTFPNPQKHLAELAALEARPQE